MHALLLEQLSIASLGQMEEGSLDLV